MRSSRQSIETTRRRSKGFTLIELIVVMMMLVLVLMTAYEILNNCMQTEKYIGRITQPEETGEAIIGLMRRDLSATFYRGLTEQLNRQIFMGTNSEGSEGGLDTVSFLSTSEPTRFDEDEFYEDLFDDYRSVTVVSYYLEQNGEIDKYPAYKLYRKEISDFSTGNALDEPGLNLEIYDKVKSLSIEYYDGYDWWNDWDSAQRLDEAEAELADTTDRMDSIQSNIQRISEDPGALDELEEQLLPPAAIPTAVRIDLELYGGSGNHIFEQDGEPILRRFRTIVPIITAQRMLIEIEDEQDLAGGGVGGEDGGAGTSAIIGGNPAVNSGGRSDRSSGRGGGGRSTGGRSASALPGRGGGTRGGTRGSAGGSRGGGGGAFGSGRR